MHESEVNNLLTKQSKKTIYFRITVQKYFGPSPKPCLPPPEIK